MGGKIAIALVLLANAALLLVVGVDPLTQIGSAAVCLILTAGGAFLLRNQERYFPDTVFFYIAAFMAGLIVFFGLGFVFLHRPLLGNAPRLAALISLAPLVVAALMRLRQTRLHRASRLVPSVAIVSALLSVAFIVSAMTAYGFGNSKEGVLIGSSGGFLVDGVPSWGVQSDRRVHIEDLVPTTYTEGFPPSRINHRGYHITVMFVTVLTGEVTSERAVDAYKTLALIFYFALAYTLFIVGKDIFGLSLPVAAMTGAAALVFSPLKIPLFQLSPTYRGFFSASGTFYHSDTQYTATAVAAIGIFLLYLSLQKQAPVFGWGCFFIAGSFFLKPPLFTALAPAAFLMVFFCWSRITKDRLTGLGLLLCVPILYFGYLAVAPGVSPVDSAIGRSETLDLKEGLAFKLGWFEGFIPRVRERFPEAIQSRPEIMILILTGMSFAAFWASWVAAARRFLKVARQGLGTSVNHLRDNAHVLFHLLFLLLAMGTAVSLAGVVAKSVNFKWAAAAAYPLSLPLFVYAITQLDNHWARLASWILFGAQILQGLGYLYYLFAYSSLF